MEIFSILWGPDYCIYSSPKSLTPSTFVLKRSSDKKDIRSGSAFLPNGVIIEGQFEEKGDNDFLPTGACLVKFDGGSIIQAVHFENGERTGKAEILYPSGIRASFVITKDTPALLYSGIVPFYRNYYNASSITMFKPVIQMDSIEIFYNNQQEQGNQFKFLNALLHHFDLHQKRMIVNLSYQNPYKPGSSFLDEIGSPGFESILENESINRVESIVFVYHDLIDQMGLYSLFPEFELTKNVNSMMLHMDKPVVSEMSSYTYMNNFKNALDILQFSRNLNSITIIGYPQSTISFSQEDKVFSSISELNLKGNLIALI